MKNRISKKMINKKTLVLSGAALVLVGSISIKSAMAYFTTYVTAKGGYEISFDTTTTIEEEKVVNRIKQVQVQNTGENPCYVRVKYFVGTELFALAPTQTDGWVQGEDDYWYYTKVLQPKGTADGTDLTSRLGMQIVAKDGTKDMFGVDGEYSYAYDFDVVVVQEYVPVQADADGNPLEPTSPDVDWTMAVKDVSGEGADE
ncbi:hypothetical protein ABXS75_01935 [Roseburia hominis]